MKKTLRLVILLLLISLSSKLSAQITKNNWLVGGEGSFSSIKYESDFIEHDNLSKLEVSSDIGYFFIDKLAIGLDLSLGFINFENSGYGSSDVKGYGVGPFVRYYFLDKEKKVNVFSQMEYNYYSTKFESRERSNSSRYLINTGTSIFLNRNVSLDLALNYSIEKSHDKEDIINDGNSLFFSVGFQIFLDKNNK